MIVELSSRIDGILEAVSVDVGDSIEESQVIAKLESEVELAALEYARAKASIDSDVRQQEVSLAYGRRQLHRIKELHEKKLSSFQDYDKVETETRLIRYKLAQAKESRHLAALDLKQAEAIYNRHTIRSPIDGIVVERYLNPGESVEERPIVKIAQINPLRVEVVAPVSLLGKIKIGQLAMVNPELPVGGSHQAVVKIVDPILDAASGTFRIRLELPNEDFSLTSGLRCQVRFLDKMATQKRESSTSKQEDSLAQEASLIEQNRQSDSRLAEPKHTLSSKTAVSVKQTREQRYLLVTHEPLMPLSKANQQAEALHQKGVKDTWVITKGSLKGHISLGYYSNRRIADNYQQQLTDLGIETRIVMQ
jgi:RND family efflux transporter MFP subunit